MSYDRESELYGSGTNGYFVEDPSLPPLEPMQEPQQEPQTLEELQQQEQSPVARGRQLPAPPDPGYRSSTASASSAVVPFLDEGDDELGDDRSQADSDGTVQVIGLSRDSEGSEGFLRHLPDRPDYDEESEQGHDRRLPANLLDILVEDDEEEFEDPQEDSKGVTFSEVPEVEEIEATTSGRSSDRSDPQSVAQTAYAGSQEAAAPALLGQSTVARAIARAQAANGTPALPLARRLPEPPQELDEPGESTVVPTSPGGEEGFEGHDSASGNSAFSLKRLFQGQSPISPSAKSVTSGRCSDLSSVSMSQFLDEEDEDDAFDETKSNKSRLSYGMAADEPQSCPAKLCQHLSGCSGRVALPVCCLLFLLGAAPAMALVPLMWMQLMPAVTLGAFANLKQVQVEQGILDAYFRGARRQALALPSVSRNWLPADPGNATGVTWRYIELYWQIWPSQFEQEKDFQPSVVSDTYMASVRTAEASLRSLPSWTRLCNMSESQVRRLCSPGDSLATVLFGTWQEPTSSERTQGMESKVAFDVASRSLVKPVETMLSFVHQSNPASLERWLPLDASSMPSSDGAKASISRQHLRSVFSFQLPEEAWVLEQWDSFVQQELRPKLLEIRAKTEADVGGGLMVFYKVDGEDCEDFDSVFNPAMFALLAAAAAVVSTFVVTRRALLSLAAGLLSAFASTVGTILAGDQVSPTAAIAWLVIALSCAELAVACNSIWAYSRIWRRPVTFAREFSKAYRSVQAMWQEDNRVLLPRFRNHPVIYVKEMFKASVQFSLRNFNATWKAVGRPFYSPIQAFGPSVCWVVMLQVIDAAFSKMPLVQEFSHPAALGSIFVLVVGPVMLVPAVLLGDILAEKHLFNDSLDGVLSLLSPRELGASPPTKDQRKQTRRCALLCVLKYEHFLVFPAFVLACVVATVIFELRGETWTFDSSTPRLYTQLHSSRASSEAKELFGGLPSPEIVANTSLKDATVCKIDADATAPCSWHICKADVEVEELEPGWCVCDYRRTALSAAGTCTASARFAGFDEMPDEFLQDQFWIWVNSILTPRNETVNISTFPVRRAEPPVEMEDWSSGSNILEKQVSCALPGAIQSDACFEAQCYCGGGTRCTRPTSGGWQSLGKTYYYGSGRRREPSRRVAQASNTTEVFMAWGLLDKYDVDSNATLSFAEAPRFEDPDVQRDLLATCQGTSPDLKVVSRRCFALDFKEWLDARGERFPVPAEDFPARIEEFSQHQQQEEDTHKYFWLSKTGSGALAGTLASFVVEEPSSSSETAALQESWSRYTELRRPWDSAGVAWMAAPQLASDEAQEAQILQEASRSITQSFIGVLALLTFVLTCSPCLALVAASSLGLCVLGLLLTMAISGIEEVGMLELLSYLAFLSSSVAPLTRFLLFYNGARNGPSRKSREKLSVCGDEEPHGEPAPRHSAADKGSAMFRYMSQCEGEDALREVARERKEKQRKEAAAERKDIRSLFARHVIRSERRNRATTALRQSAEIMFGYSLCGVLLWLTLIGLAPQALGEVGRAFPLLAILVPVVGLSMLPVIILMGFSPSRVWGYAFFTFFGAISGFTATFGGPACSFPHLRTPEDVYLEIRSSSRVLGWPFTAIGSSWIGRHEEKRALERESASSGFVQSGG